MKGSECTEMASGEGGGGGRGATGPVGGIHRGLTACKMEKGREREA